MFSNRECKDHHTESIFYQLLSDQLSIGFHFVSFHLILLRRGQINLIKFIESDVFYLIKVLNYSDEKELTQMNEHEISFHTNNNSQPQIAQPEFST